MFQSSSVIDSAEYGGSGLFCWQMGKSSPLKPNSLQRAYKHTLGRPNFNTNQTQRNTVAQAVYTVYIQPNEREGQGEAR